MSKWRVASVIGAGQMRLGGLGRAWGHNVLLSELFDGKTDGGDWFDVLLDSDTRLFVDPFLIYKETEGRWAGAHDELIAHFDETFKTLAKSGGRKKAPIT
jgi:hypothetical protein